MRRHIPHVTILSLAVAVAACTGSGSADPTSPPSSTASATPPAPTATTASPPLPEASPTLTAEATPSPTTEPTPTPTFTGGIDPPTEAPEGFSEFSVPPPDDLTEEYAAWVLAVFTRAEDELVRMTVHAPDEEGSLPDDVTVALNSLYAGDSLQIETELAQETITSPPADEAFREEPGSSTLSHIQLLDATQDCLLLQYVEDVRELLKSGGDPEQLIALFKPKPEIDASSFNATPWHMTNRTVPQDVDGRSCD